MHEILSQNGLGKNGLARPILDEKMVQLDHFWPTVTGPTGLILANKVIRHHQLRADVSKIAT